MNRWHAAFVTAVAAIGVAYATLERATDAWPALLVFLLGGFICGLVTASRWALAVCPLAGALGNAIWHVAVGSDHSAVELSLPLAVILGVLVGATGVPAVLLGMYSATRSGRRPPVEAG